MQQVAQIWISELLLRAPFIAALGVNIVSATRDRVHVRLPYREQISCVGTYIHSAAVAALIEFAGTVAAVSGIGDEDGVAGCITSQLTINYFSPPSGPYVDAVATVAHRTRRQVVTDIAVLRDNGAALAKATAICRIFEQHSIERAA